MSIFSIKSFKYSQLLTCKVQMTWNCRIYRLIIDNILLQCITIFNLHAPAFKYNSITIYKINTIQIIETKYDIFSTTIKILHPNTMLLNISIIHNKLVLNVTMWHVLLHSEYMRKTSVFKTTLCVYFNLLESSSTVISRMIEIAVKYLITLF